MATTTLPARVEEYTPLQAQSTYTKAEQAAFKKLHDYIQQHTKDNIWWYWDLGQTVAEIYKEAQSKKELYGNKVLFRLGLGLGFKTDRQLRNAMDVCAAFGTKKAFTEYIKLRGQAGNMLSWSHLVYLAGVGDKDLRMQLAAAALEQSWTAEDLWQKVRELCERKKRGIQTPKTKVPNSARGCLTHVQSQATKFNYNYDNAWTGDAFNLSQVIKDIPADKLNDKLLDQVRSAKEQVVELQKRAADMANLLAATEAEIVARMTAQAELAAQQTTEMAEAAGTDGDDDDDEAETASLSEARNKQARDKRAAAKKRKGTKRAGRVGVSR